MGAYIDISTTQTESQQDALQTSVGVTVGHVPRKKKLLLPVNGHNGTGVAVNPYDTIPYTASGGDSERRKYENGEGLTIEKHRRSFSLLWTAREPSPADFMHRLGALVAAPSAGQVIVAPSDDDGGEYPFADALAGLDEGSLAVDFIHVVFPEAAFTWQAANGSAKNHSTARSKIGAIWKQRSQFRPDLLRALIDETATEHVAADIDGILKSTEQLTGDFKPVAS